MSWPRTLYGRVGLILISGLLLAQALTFGFVLLERGQVMRGLMVSYLAADVGSSVAMLDRLPAAERAAWLPRLQRPNYRLFLDFKSEAALSSAPMSPLAGYIAEALEQVLGGPVAIGHAREPEVMFRLQLRLRDGAPVGVEVAQPRLRLSPWLVLALAAQLAMLAGVCGLAVRQVTRPLRRLATAASELDPARPYRPLAETGPSEVAEAAIAFNGMQQRIATHGEERSQMLAAISHDLQTPITRMRLRAELLTEEALRDKLQADLLQMQHLVEQGLAYARTLSAVQEALVGTDLPALLQSMVADYQDAAQPVQWCGGPPAVVSTRPRALRRVVGNLIDNALKFGGVAQLALVLEDGQPTIQVLDRGPGIPVAELDKVMRPFYRIEASRSPATGGSGLGLAIAKGLMPPCQAELSLEPRPGGGLAACIRFGRRKTLASGSA